MICEVCGKEADVTAINDITEDKKEHHFCDKHYWDWVRNEIEIPAERLEVLE